MTRSPTLPFASQFFLLVMGERRMSLEHLMYIWISPSTWPVMLNAVWCTLAFDHLQFFFFIRIFFFLSGATARSCICISLLFSPASIQLCFLVSYTKISSVLDLFWGRENTNSIFYTFLGLLIRAVLNCFLARVPVDLLESSAGLLISWCIA